ncbi:hypothetical protein ARAF_0835 [Arsenophonus endosymbiont of Aleurodicus floccissimus]|nr:hypothetical protein ARAF_0835 [Arsenophonus endosymbiont of Aleurodicus floccissimus]
MANRLNQGRKKPWRWQPLAERNGLDALPDSAFSPGIKQCQFCKAKGGLCFTQAQFVHNEVRGDFVDLTQPLTPQLSDEPTRITLLTLTQMAKLYQHVNLIESFCKALRNRIAEALHNG